MKIPLLALLLSLPLVAEEASSISAMKSAAASFLGSLDETQRAKASFPFEGDARENFRFTPQTRTGLPLKEMSESQASASKSSCSMPPSDIVMLPSIET